MKTFFKQASVTMPFGHYFLSLIMLPALMLLLSMNVMAQGNETVTSFPAYDSNQQVHICVGGTVTIQVENSDNGHTYRLSKTAPSPVVTLQEMTGNGGTIVFNDVDIFSSTGNIVLTVVDANDFHPFFSITVVVYPDPVAPVLSKDPNQAAVCAGTNISATVSTNGSGGVTGSDDKFQYSTDGGNSWVTYTPGDDISTTGLSGTDIVQIRSWRADDEGRGCFSGYNIYKWTVNALPVPTITGDSDVCSGSVKTYVTQSGMTNYLWTIDGGTGTSATNSIDVTWGNAGSGKVSANFTDVNGCTALSPTEYMVDKVDAPDINSIIIQSTTDQLVWQDLPGDIGAGFSMFLNPTAQFMYLDVKTFTATTDIMSNHLNPFYLDQANLPAGWDQYWIDRGVVSGAAGWQGVMYEIITGDEPIFYLYKTGSDYQLIDGLQYQIGQGMQMLRVSGDYPAGEYTYNGILYSTLGCSSELSIDMTYSKKVLNVTQQKTYGTIQDAIDDANSAGGDLINVYEGSYEENLNIDKSLTLKPASGEEVILQGYGGVMDPEEPGFGDLDIGIFIDADNVTVEGLIITGFDWGIDVWGENNIISGNNVSEASGAGISIYGADNIINGNILNDNYEAVVVSETSGNLIQDNRIFDNGAGLVNNTTDWINVASNWWGDSSGPESNPYNTCGQGNLVSDYVIFWPWFTDDAEEPMVSTATLSVTNISKAPNTAYCKIQDAIDDAGTGGETIVVGDGIYYENIIINKANLILVNGSSPLIDGGGNGTVVTITANDITFEGFSVQNSGSTQNDAGIFLQNVTGCTVKSNNITSNAHGIALAYGSANILYDNEINGNSYYGVAFAGTSGNTIELNTIGANGLDAIALDNASAVGGSVSIGSNGNFIKTNTISSSLRDGIFIGENCTTNQITDQNEINDITGIGIHVWRDGAQVISDNIINNTLVGIKLRGAVNSVISGNVISENATGLEIEQFYLGGNWYTSDNNTIEHNNIYDNTTGVKADNNGGVLVDVTCNWWGTQDSYEVEQFLNGSIQFLPFLNEDASGDIEPWWSSGQKYSCEGYGPVLVYDNDPATGNLVSSHMTIQGAIDASTTSGGYYIIVNEGIYKELVTVNKSLTILGPNAGISGTSNIRNTEAKINYPDNYTSTKWNAFIVTILASNVTIDGFMITDEGYATISGPTYFTGIQSGSYGDTKIKNNIIDGFNYCSILLQGGGGILVENNYTKNCSAFSSIYLQNAAGTVRNNKVENAPRAIQIQPYDNTIGGEVYNNDFEGFISGIYYNYAKKGAGKWNIYDNQISAAPAPTAGTSFEGAWQGISLRTFGTEGSGDMPEVDFYRNSVDGSDASSSNPFWTAVRGVEIKNARGMANFSGNIIANTEVAVYAHNDSNVSEIVFNENSFEGSTSGVVNLAASELNATCNWWGATDPATIEASVSGSVVMAPWLVDGTDGDLATAGFQPATPCVTCDLTASAFAVNASCSNISDGEVSAYSS
jgi:parallel beta-helix repeat protein